MFHKEGSSTTSSNEVTLRKSDQRRLRRDVVKFLKIAPEDLLTQESFWVSAFSDLKKRTIRLNNKGKALIFIRAPNSKLNTIEDQREATIPSEWPFQYTTQPLVFELDGSEKNKKVYVPSIALLACLPPFTMPSVIVHSAVSKFLCRGADLMRSGIVALSSDVVAQNSDATSTATAAVSPKRFKSGSIVTIVAHPNPQAFAVGEVLSDLARNTFGPGTKGVAVRVISCYGDDLWKEQFDASLTVGCESSSFDDGHYGNPGFLDGKLVCPLVGDDAVSTCSESSVQCSDGGEQDGDEAKAFNEENEDKVAVSESVNVSAHQKNDAQDSSASILSNEANKLSLDSAENGGEEEGETSAEDHDALLLQALYNSLNTTVKDKMLPIPVSMLYAGHILPAVKDIGTHKLDMKKTKHRKIGVFLKEQASLDLISLSPSKDRKDPAAFLSKVNRADPQLRAAKKLLNSNPGLTGSKSSGKGKEKLKIANLLIVPHKIVTSMMLAKDMVSAANAKSADRKGTGFLTGPECREILSTYLEHNDLFDPNDPGYVIIDGPLGDALWGQTKKQRQAAQAPSTQSERPTRLSRKLLQEKWSSKMETAYAIVAMPGSKIVALKRGQPPKVLIEVEKRQGNKKFTTRVRGLEEVSRIASLFFRTCK